MTQQPKDTFLLHCSTCELSSPFRLNVPAQALGNAMRKLHRDLHAKTPGCRCADDPDRLGALSVHLNRVVEE